MSGEQNAAFDPEAKFLEGWALHQRGQVAAAWGLYQQVIAAAPRHFNALHLAGIIAAQARQHDQAIDLIGRALTVEPGNAAAHYNLGNVLKDIDRHQDAIASYDRAIALDPANADPYNNRGSALLSLKRYDDAVAGFDQAIALKPDYAEAHYNRGNALRGAKDFEAALAGFDKAIALKPDYAEAYNNRGNTLRGLKRFDDAIASFDRAIALKPDYAEAYNNRGTALQNLERSEEAAASYDKAIALKPDHADAFYNRAVAQRLLKQPQAALASYDAALRLNPGHADSYFGRGVVHVSLKDYARAIIDFGRAIALDPAHADARWSLAVCRLQMGNFAEGWEGYEARWQAPQANLETRNFTQLLWRGQDDLAGKTILLHAEQGFGDTLQFVRYVPLVAAKAARVILEVQPPLVTLLQNLADHVIAKGDPLPPFDVQCPLLTLPLAFGTDAATIPAPQGYLTPAPSKRADWAERLGAKTQPRIGLAWSGNPIHGNDALRSIPLADVISALPKGFTYVALQKDIRTGERALLDAAGISYFGDAITDFSDTAALCTLMDTVISVDTSIAHLAGALAVPVWILLPFNPDWRWMLDHNASPWYDAAVLYRQETPGDWNAVLARVALALTRKTAHTS